MFEVWGVWGGSNKMEDWIPISNSRDSNSSIIDILKDYDKEYVDEEEGKDKWIKTKWKTL